MSDLFSLLNRTVRALDAQRFGLDVTGQNIANVNTPGYARRTIQLAEPPSSDPFGAGAGVDVVSVLAARTPLIDARLRYEEPASAQEGAVADHLAVVEAGLGQPGASLDAELSRFYNTYGALSQDPTSSTARQQVIVQGQQLSRAFNDMATRFQTAQQSADTELRSSVNEVNAIAQQLADLNTQIGQTEAGNAQDLLDRQDVLLQNLGQLVDAHVIQADNGTVNVQIGNGRSLVTGSHAYALTATATGSTGFASVFTDGAAVTTDVTTEIGGGKIGGLIRVRDTLVPNYASQLDQLAYSVSRDVNALTTGGYDVNGTAGTNFFAQPTVVSGAASQMAVSSTVAANNDLVVAASTTAPGNNDVARAIQALQDAPMTGSTARPVEAWGALVYSVATDSSVAKQAQTAHDQVAEQLRTMREQTSGISIDEEAAQLMRFQRAYEANAKFFQTVDATLDQLMSLTRY